MSLDSFIRHLARIQARIDAENAAKEQNGAPSEPVAIPRDERKAARPGRKSA